MREICCQVSVDFLINEIIVIPTSSEAGSLTFDIPPQGLKPMTFATKLVWTTLRMWSSKAHLLIISCPNICFTQPSFFAVESLDENLANLACLGHPSKHLSRLKL